MRIDISSCLWLLVHSPSRISCFAGQDLHQMVVQYELQCHSSLSRGIKADGMGCKSSKQLQETLEDTKDRDTKSCGRVWEKPCTAPLSSHHLCGELDIFIFIGNKVNLFLSGLSNLRSQEERVKPQLKISLPFKICLNIVLFKRHFSASHGSISSSHEYQLALAISHFSKRSFFVATRSETQSLQDVKCKLTGWNCVRKHPVTSCSNNAVLTGFK